VDFQFKGTLKDDIIDIDIPGINLKFNKLTRDGKDNEEDKYPKARMAS